MPSGSVPASSRARTRCVAVLTTSTSPDAIDWQQLPMNKVPPSGVTPIVRGNKPIPLISLPASRVTADIGLAAAAAGVIPGRFPATYTVFPFGLTTMAPGDRPTVIAASALPEAARIGVTVDEPKFATNTVTWLLAATRGTADPAATAGSTTSAELAPAANSPLSMHPPLDPQRTKALPATLR